MTTALYIAVMAGVTYLVRMLPFTLFRQRIRSKFLKSFLFCIPYAVLSAMTFPAILYSTGSTVTAAAGTAVALLLSYFNKPLIVVALAAAAVSYICGLFI